MKKIIAAALVSVAAFSTAAVAAEKGEFTPYAGMDYTYSDTTAKFVRPHYNSGSFNVGTMYNSYFGTELFYQFSDSHKMRDELDKTKTSFQAYGLDLMGYLPLGCDRTVSLIGTAGVGEYIFRKDFSDDKKNRDSGLGWRAGLGAMYNVDENWSIRALARFVNFNQIEEIDHAMEYSAGVRYTF